MSKSLKNFVTVQDLVHRGIKGEAARLFLLSNHYRKPIDYNEKATLDSNRTISYWYRAVENIEEKLQIHEELSKVFVQSLLDDLNTHNAIKITNDFAKEAHASTSVTQKIKAASNMLTCARFLGLMANSTKEWFQGEDDTSQIDQLIAQRTVAKLAKDWDLADNIRTQLLDMGIVIEDKADGSTVWKKI